jgi:NDP-sugar pyrophosphorylase family protein
MKAMILAAGLGTRLRPLTDNRPKALVTLNGCTLLEIALRRLQSVGVREVIVNTHHHAAMVAEFLRANHNFDMRIELSREESLLETGGGLKQAAWFFTERSPSSQEPFILHNVDVISTIHLDRMMQVHIEQAALATLAVQHRESSRSLLFGENGFLSGRRNSDVSQSTPSQSDSQQQPLAFSGIHILSPQIFSKLIEEGAFSIIDAYVRLAQQGERIMAYRDDQCYWRDLGRPESIAQASQEISDGLYVINK